MGKRGVCRDVCALAKKGVSQFRKTDGRVGRYQGGKLEQGCERQPCAEGRGQGWRMCVASGLPPWEWYLRHLTSFREGLEGGGQKGGLCPRRRLGGPGGC